MNDLYRLLLGVLCVWRITHLLQAEDGPGDFVAHLRRAAGDGFFGRLMDCFYCLSLWVSVGLAWPLGHAWFERLLLWLAFSGGASLLERSTSGRGAAQIPIDVAKYQEDDFEHHVQHPPDQYEE